MVTHLVIKHDLTTSSWAGTNLPKDTISAYLVAERWRDGVYHRVYHFTPHRWSLCRLAYQEIANRDSFVCTLPMIITTNYAAGRFRITLFVLACPLKKKVSMMKARIWDRARETVIHRCKRVACSGIPVRFGAKSNTLLVKVLQNPSLRWPSVA